MKRLTKIFLSTYPVRGTTVPSTQYSPSLAYFYPRTPCGVRRPAQRGAALPCDISIHVPRAGYDAGEKPKKPWVFKISIHVPRAGYDLSLLPKDKKGNIFLSTYPVRGTTDTILRFASGDSISIHVPRAGYDLREQLTHTRHGISIHVPRAGYDCLDEACAYIMQNFYPRTPCGVRLAAKLKGVTVEFISIHVPRAGYDLVWLYFPIPEPYFYPRTPCGVRLHYAILVPIDQAISIHVPRAGYDSSPGLSQYISKSFLSTYPVRGTTIFPNTSYSERRNFYPRTPCGVRLGLYFSR